MAPRKLINELNEKLQKDLDKKFKLDFDEKKLNTSLLETLKDVCGTSSTGQVIEKAFFQLATSELNKQDSIHSFPAYDYIQKLEFLGKKHSENGRSVYILRWNVVATSKFVRDKYSQLEFKSVEEVLDLVISFLAEQTKSLWS